ncbi:MAG: hypothetical protein LBS19_02595 [Clostridiales bacterium]|nr:hypothetical protein [Clostridiales bacterium]
MPGTAGPRGAKGDTGPTGAAVGIAPGVNLFNALDSNGYGVRVLADRNVTFQTNTPTGINISVVPGASGAVVTIDNTLENKLRRTITENNRMIMQLLVSVNYDEVETPTGSLYNGKPVYRRAFNFTVSRGAYEQDDAPIVPVVGYIDSIINSGGYWATGNGIEKYAVNATYGTTVPMSAFAYIRTQNELFFKSASTLNRSLSPTFAWVDYTKV